MEAATGTMDEIRQELVSLAPYLDSPERDDFRGFLDTFGSCFPRYAEISTTPHHAGIGVMTRGTGEDYTAQVRNYLLSAGMSEEAVKIFDQAAWYFPGISLLVKYDFSPERLLDFSLYWQYLVPLRLLERLSRKFEIPREVMSALREYSLLLRNSSVYLGMSFSLPDTVQFRVFFQSPLQKSSHFLAPALAALLGMSGMDAVNINYFLGIHSYLAQRAKGSVYTSLGFDKTTPAGVKIDYEIIPPECAIEVMKALDVNPDEGMRMVQAMKALEMRNLTYLGIRFAPRKKPAVKFYFDRRYSEKNRENAQVLADVLRDTIWIP